jgi:hypothetical protein
MDAMVDSKEGTNNIGSGANSDAESNLNLASSVKKQVSINQQSDVDLDLYADVDNVGEFASTAAISAAKRIKADDIDSGENFNSNGNNLDLHNNDREESNETSLEKSLQKDAQVASENKAQEDISQKSNDENYKNNEEENDKISKEQIEVTNNEVTNGGENKNITKSNDEDANMNEDGVIVSAIDDTGLYDDVMAAPASNLSSNEYINNELATNANPMDENELDDKLDGELANGSASSMGGMHGTGTSSSAGSGSLPANSNFTKRVSCYIGNLTWWTSDKDLSDAIALTGVNDLLEIKFYENKINGQSKGFAMVTVGSDQSFRTLMEKMPKKQLNGQEPIVTNFSRHAFNQFEEQARKDMPSSAGTSSGTTTPNSSLIEHGIYHGQQTSHNVQSQNPQQQSQQQQHQSTQQQQGSQFQQPIMSMLIRQFLFYKFLFLLKMNINVNM